MKLPRVTEILSPFSDFSMVPPDVLEAAAERGTAVHEACAAYALNFPLPFLNGAEGYFKSFQSWFDRYVVDVLAVEEEVINQRWGYVGHVDLIALIAGVRPKQVIAVIDYKTPYTESLSWHCQTQAYVEASREKYGAEIGGALRLRRDGSLPVMGWVQNPARAFNAFCGILCGWNYLRGGK